MFTGPDHERIGRFLATVYEAGEARRPERLAIRHVAANDRQAEVASLPLGAEPPDEETVGSLIGRILEAVATDAEGLGGLQRYVIIALREGQPLARVTVRHMALNDAPEDEPLDSEPPNSTGLIAQLMRHNEAQTRLYTLSMSQVLGTMQRTIARLQLSSEESESKRAQYIGLVEDLASLKADRDIAKEKASAEIDNRKRVFEKVVALLPAVAAHLLARGRGNGSGPARAAQPDGGPGRAEPDEDLAAAVGGASQDKEAAGTGAPDVGATGAPAAGPIDMLRTLLASVSPDQMAGLAGILSPEQIELLRGLFAGADDGADGASPPGSDIDVDSKPTAPEPDPVSDAAGQPKARRPRKAKEGE